MISANTLISIENVWASTTLDQKLNLKEITKKISELEYSKNRFPMAVFRSKKPKTVTILFSTGKMMCTSAKSEETAKKAIKTVVNLLKKEGIKTKKEPEIKIQNIVASINLGKKINLEQVARTLPYSIYEPDQFPGIIHRVVEPKTVILLFASGKLVCTGGKTIKDIYRAVNFLQYWLERKKLIIYD